MSIDRLARAMTMLKSGAVATPPEGDIFVGDGDFIAISAEFLAYFVEQGELQPGDTVLDIGCGIGRMAAGLACYLDPDTGRYFGFDPVAKGIEWCRQAFANHPNFKFELMDVYNELYRRDGRVLSTQYRFPLNDGSIDLVILTSVFTHLYYEEVEGYLKEIGRLLNVSGRAFITAYLFDGEAPLRRPSVPHLDFTVKDETRPEQWHVSVDVPLAAVAFQTAAFVDLVKRTTGRQPTVYPGRWRGGNGPWFQDLVIL